MGADPPKLESRLALAHTNPPHAILIEPNVRQALEEDLGRAGDITTDAIISPGQMARAVIAAREAGTVCGLIAASIAFRLIDSSVSLSPRAPDGSKVPAGEIIATLEGPARAILTAERVARPEDGDYTHNNMRVCARHGK